MSPGGPVGGAARGSKRPLGFGTRLPPPPGEPRRRARRRPITPKQPTKKWTFSVKSLICFGCLPNFRGLFVAIMLNLVPPRPRQSPRNVFLVDSASHERSGAHLEQIFDHFPGEEVSNSRSGRHQLRLQVWISHTVIS